MSSRHKSGETSRRREGSPSCSEHRRDHRARSRDKHSRERQKQKIKSISPSTTEQKHRSDSREKKGSRDRSESSKRKKSKKKKKKHSSSSSSSPSSDSDEEELKLLQRLESERLRLKEEKRKQKEMMKAMETPEQKRARRLREKQEKERKRRERMGWDTEYQCYTNQDNPFGDSALTNTFVWTKKLAKEGVKSVSREELEALNRQKQLENKIELEKVKQRRLEREAERAEREAEALAAARAREAAQFSSWARQEDAFHLHQARLRSQIRIRDGRAKPIDLLAWYVSSEDCVDALEMHEPYTYLNGLQMQDLEDLLEDIKVYMELENNSNASYWADVQTIVRDELGKLRRLAAPGARRDGVHQAVAGDVALIFKGKSGAQLQAMQAQIERKISGRRDGVDVGYWESLLSQLMAHMARARLRDRHQENLRRKLQLLKQEQGVQPGDGAGAAAPAPAGREPKRERSRSREAGTPPLGPGPGPGPGETPAEAQASALAAADASAEAEAEAAAEAAEERAEEACEAQYAAGRYSPARLSPRALEPGTLLTEPAEDAQRLAYLRARLLAAAERAAGAAEPRAAAAGDAPPAAAAAEPLEAAARRAMGPAGAAEAQFSAEHALPEAPCPWADKYRPRKPRYFNRVHTGFEWNKYNQTHYDMDNPPPKIVQGYKFNIFYPDLIDNTSTPEFSLKPCAENPEFAVLRFHAGPPYEDIAFKIVNREWEYSYKRGFRCHFHNNIFQLWFHFKRYRYRR